MVGFKGYPSFWSLVNRQKLLGELIAGVKSRGDEEISSCEQILLIQEVLLLTCKMELHKKSPSHSCLLLLEQMLQIQEDLFISEAFWAYGA